MEEELRTLSNGDAEHSKEDESDISEPSVDFRDNEARGTWGSKAEFFLAIMGYTVGIGSVWRFPMVCSRNGGGAFLIPFFFFLIIIGGPLYYLEVCLGQFTGLSSGLAFEFCPLFKGIGLLQVMLAGLVVWYCGMILAWGYYFLYWSFFPDLPWARCDQPWNTDRCFDSTHVLYGQNVSSMISGVNNDTHSIYNSTDIVFQSGKMQSPSYEFWEFKVIGRSAGFEEPGQVQGHLAICLLIAWATVVLAVIKGVKTLGKVVYVTATVPYVMLTVVLIRGITLNGAMDGIWFYLKPNFDKLTEARVWIDAAVQVFYSLGPGWGGVITMASYNKFHQKSFWSSTMCVAASGFTSFYNGLVVFTIIGFMASETGTEVEVIARKSGPGLVFVAFPTAISKLPLPQLWSVLFFFAFITVAYDSVFGMFETVTSCLVDMFPRKLIRRRVLVNIAVGIALFVTGLPLTLNCGIHLLQLCEWYFSQYGLLLAAILECITLCWIYGTERFSLDIELMTGQRVSTALRVLWAVIIPGLGILVFVILCFQYSTPDYGDGYVYSTLALYLGFFSGLIPIIAMVATGFWVLLNLQGTLKQRFRRSLRPSPAWRPNDAEASKSYRLKHVPRPDSIWERILLNLSSRHSS